MRIFLFFAVFLIFFAENVAGGVADVHDGGIVVRTKSCILNALNLSLETWIMDLDTVPVYGIRDVLRNLPVNCSNSDEDLEAKTETALPFPNLFHDYRDNDGLDPHLSEVKEQGFKSLYPHQLTIHSIGLWLFVVFLSCLATLFVILLYRCYAVCIYRWNSKHTLPDYRDVVFKSKQYDPKKVPPEEAALEKTLLADFKTVHSYLQPSNTKPLTEEAFQVSFGRLCEHYLPETAQPVKDAFFEDFSPVAAATEEENLNLVLYGSVPEFRISVLSSDEHKKLKEEAEKKKNNMTITQ